MLASMGSRERRQRQGRPLATACAAVALLLSLATGVDAASAATTYLRPNADGSSTAAWSVVGAPTAWEALDDNVTQAQTPSSSDYIASSGASGYATVGLKTMSLAGATGVQMTAWVYTANAGETIVDVLKSNSGGRVGRA